MPDQECHADGTARVSRGGLDPDVLEWALAQDASVADAVEGNSASKAEILRTRLGVQMAGNLQHDFFGDMLDRCSDVHMTLGNRLVWLSGRFSEERVEGGPGHREALARIAGFEQAAAADDEGVREALLRLPHDALLELLDERERESLEYGYRERVDDMHLPHVAELPRVLPDLFAQAARRARAAGFDGVAVMVENTPIDYLDFASPVSGLGSKIGFDATNKWKGETQREWGVPITMDKDVKNRVDEMWDSLGI